MGSSLSCVKPKAKEEYHDHHTSIYHGTGKSVDLSYWMNAEAERNKWLTLIPNRIVSSGSLRTTSIHSAKGNKGFNQDSVIAWEDFMIEEGCIFVGVFDGHGPDGHKVSKQVRDSLCLRIYQQFDHALRTSASDSDHQRIQTESAGPATLTDLFPEIKTAIAPTKPRRSFQGKEKEREKEKEGKVEVRLKPKHGDIGWGAWERVTHFKRIHAHAFHATEDEILENPCQDKKISGSTAVTALLLGKEVFIACLGDSRVVLGKCKKDGSYEAKQITEDHKCSLPQEKQRIESSKGRVFAAVNDPDVPRAWLPNEPIPGLAVSRAFGDYVLKPYGVTHVPDVFNFTVSDADRFLILATDGLWDVLSNEEAVDIVATALDYTEAAALLVETAQTRWQENSDSKTMDDCTVAILYLHPKLLEKQKTGNNEPKKISVPEPEPEPAPETCESTKAFYSEAKV